MTGITLKEIPVQVLNVPDGSVLVLRVPRDMTQEDMHGLYLAMQEAFPAERRVEVRVLTNNIDLAVIDK